MNLILNFRRSCVTGILTLLCFQSAHSKTPVSKTEVTSLATLPPARNKFYIGNREPLLPTPLTKLPISAIQPDGWLHEQLKLSADGFTGHLPEISQWCKFDGSGWTTPGGWGKFGWEEAPYWLKGFTDLGYVLRNPRIMAESKKWIDGILSSQRGNGYFGSEENFKTLDLWPNMAALYALRSHFEATGDPRILKFMTKYFHWVASLPREKILPKSWQHIRGGDQLDSIHWLYNRTGEKFLLDLAKLTHERTANWTDGIPSWHGVNIAQGFREPAEFFLQSGNQTDLDAATRNYLTVMDKYGQVPGGMFGADENCREGFTGPRQAAETCTMVEFMWSDEMLLGITGNRAWADRCEEIAFNSLPASMSPDLKALHYLTAPNQIQLDRTNKAPMIENGGDMFSFNPHEYRCCQHNVAFGWPYFAEHLWMAAGENGLAATFYAPSVVKAKVGDGTEIKITEATVYPFDETVTFTIETPRDVEFPLTLRVPSWSKEPKVFINGEALNFSRSDESWIQLKRAWKNDDRVQLILPMDIRVKVWEKNKNSVSVSRGPLTYSLKIGEKQKRYGGTDKWPAFEVFPTTPWSYGLIVDEKNPASSFEVLKRTAYIVNQPFALDHAPVELRAKGKMIPQWKQEANGLVGEIQQSPVRSDEKVQNITLIPMGCARLRISAFPQIGDGADANDWK